MTTLPLPVLSEPSTNRPRIAFVGNPNAGKTSLFNALTGLRSKTANFPGITVDLREGRLSLADREVDLLDLPGLYSLDALSPEESVTQRVLTGGIDGEDVPEVVLLVLDATRIERHLFLASEVLDLKLPTIVAVNLIDAAKEAGVNIDVEQLSASLGVPVVPVSARTGTGLDELRESLAKMLDRKLPVLGDDHTSCVAGCDGCTFAARYDWASGVAGRTVHTPDSLGKRTARVDRWLTNPLVGVLMFIAVMLGVFYLIFAIADIPMTLIDEGFGWAASTVGTLLPETLAWGPVWAGGVFAMSMAAFALGYRLKRKPWTRNRTILAVVVSGLIAALPVDDARSLLIDGIIGGVGGVVIFLPQICILFFFISLLEESGYMARAAFVMERLMRAVGLPGKAFVPMLSAHACAIPGIMAARVIESWRDRLATILVLPLLTCSARLPVYAMVAALLFSGSPGKASLVFVGAYLLGIIAALGSAWVLKKTILKGESEPLVLELPDYRRPGLRNALLTVIDRGGVFLRKAGTAILAISVVLWALATYPKLPESEVESITATASETLDEDEVERKVDQERLSYSFAGRLGRATEPIFRPLGFDWKINVGVLSSFAAREVIVSTLAIVYELGEDAAEENETLVETLRRQTHEDGSPVFTTATCLSLLVFYVLAMQCLPTQVVTKRETGSWKWAGLQLGYMTALAYVAALVTYQITNAIG